MKTNIAKKLVVLFVCILLFSSCIKKDNSAEPTVKIPTKTSELVVPEGFDWKTSMNVSCDFKSTNNASVRVSLALENGGESFAAFYVGGEAETISVNLPTYVEEVFVSYYTETGESKAERLVVKDSKLSYTVPSDAKVYVDEMPIPLRAAKYATRANKNATITYPASGWGAVMFEDLYPSYGDYDFNDVVVGYKIQLYPNNKNQVREMLIGLVVRAQGGSLPYEIYLRMLGVKGREIDYVEILSEKNTNPNFDMVAMNAKNSVKDPAVIKFVNMRQEGMGCVNTVEGQILKDDQLVKIEFYVELRNPVSIEPIGQNDYGLGAESFDFFIAKSDDSNNVREIHISGAEPAMSSDYNENIRKEHPNTNKCKAFYLSNHNLVWGINIPAAIAHPYEKIDIMSAYPDFAKWVQSGGVINKDWYKNKLNDKVVIW